MVSQVSRRLIGLAVELAAAASSHFCEISTSLIEFEAAKQVASQLAQVLQNH